MCTHADTYFYNLPKVIKVVIRAPILPVISPSEKKGAKTGSRDKVTRVVSRNV